MRVVSDVLDDEVSGTTSGDRLEVWVWRGGDLVVDKALSVGSYQLGWDASRQTQGQASITIDDPDGKLAPWALDDSLGPGGSRLQITHVMGGSETRVPLGWWLIRSAPSREQWRAYNTRPRASVIRTPGGGRITLNADEEVTARASVERLDPGETVQSSTCLGEVARLLDGIAGLRVLSGVTDVPVPAGLVWGESRISAVEEMLAYCQATHRAGSDGSLEAVPLTGVGPVWTVQGGDDGVLIDVQRALSDAEVFNGAIATGKTPDGAPLVGRATIPSGPLAWGGPFGRRPLYVRATGTTAPDVQAEAVAALETWQASGEVDLPVQCLAHPGIQMHDLVTVVAPTRAGDEPLVGRVVSMTLRSATSDRGSTPAKAMDLVVRVPRGMLELVAAKVRNAR